MLNGGNNTAVSKQVMILKDSLLKYEYENVLKLKKNPPLILSVVDHRRLVGDSFSGRHNVVTNKKIQRILTEAIGEIVFEIS